MSIFGQLLLQVILIALNAFFAATEIAVISLNATKLRKQAEDGDKVAPKLLKLVEAPAGFLSIIQICITLSGFLGSAFAADNFAGPLVSWVENTLNFRLLPTSVLNTLAVILITIILSYFTLVFGELVPKRIAMQRPMGIAVFSYRIIRFLGIIFKPIIVLLSLSTNGLLRLLHMKTEAEEDSATEDDIRMMVDLGGEKGTIDAEEHEWIQNVFDFNDIPVREIMTRAIDVEAFQIDTPEEEIVARIRESGLSRFPVYGEDLNDILGLLSARVFLLNRQSSEPRPLRELLQPVYFVPETIHADKLFRDMQHQKIHFAVVIDEYGETGGIITMEDLLEEIVGNIYDEFDPAEPQELEKIGENRWKAAGSLDLETLSETLEAPLPEGEGYDTLGGLVLSTLSAIPADGSTFDVTVAGLNIHVTDFRNHRVESAEIEKIQPAPEEEPQEEE